MSARRLYDVQYSCYGTCVVIYALMATFVRHIFCQWTSGFGEYASRPTMKDLTTRARMLTRQHVTAMAASSGDRRQLTPVHRQRLGTFDEDPSTQTVQKGWIINGTYCI